MPNKKYFIMDNHCHIGRSNLLIRTSDIKSGFFSCDDAIRYMDEAEVTACCAFPTSAQNTDYRETNEYILEGAKKYPKRIIPYARMNPYFTDTVVSDVAEYAKRGIKGLKFHPFLDGAYPANDRRLVYPIIEEAAKHNLLCIFHSGDAWNATPGLIADLALDFPNVKFIIAHSGMYGFHMEALAWAKRIKNLYLDTTELIPPYWVKACVEAAGRDRVLFGSDIPYIPYSNEINKILNCAGLDEITIEAVLGKNLASLLEYDY